MALVDALPGASLGAKLTLAQHGMMMATLLMMWRLVRLYTSWWLAAAWFFATTWLAPTLLLPQNLLSENLALLQWLARSTSPGASSTTAASS